MPDGFNELREEYVNIISTYYYIIGNALHVIAFPFKAEYWIAVISCMLEPIVWHEDVVIMKMVKNSLYRKLAVCISEGWNLFLMYFTMGGI